MTQPTASDLALNLPQMLDETEQAIAALRAAEVPIPDEAHQIAAILRRCIAAERAVKPLLANLRFAIHCFEHPDMGNPTPGALANMKAAVELGPREGDS